MSDARELIDRYFDLAPQPDADAYFAQFADDAIVEDEDQTYRGIAAIRAWRAKVLRVAYTASQRRKASAAEYALAPDREFAASERYRSGSSGAVAAAAPSFSYAAQMDTTSPRNSRIREIVERATEAALSTVPFVGGGLVVALTAHSGLSRSRGMGAEQPERARRGEFDKKEGLASGVLHDLDVRGRVWGALRAQESEH
jgi:hypothetical protein